jgi:hypothetical protein
LIPSIQIYSSSSQEERNYTYLELSLPHKIET